MIIYRGPHAVYDFTTSPYILCDLNNQNNNVIPVVVTYPLDNELCLNGNGAASQTRRRKRENAFNLTADSFVSQDVLLEILSGNDVYVANYSLLSMIKSSS